MPSIQSNNLFMFVGFLYWLLGNGIWPEPGINLGGAMGKIAPDFSKCPLHLESMGPFL